MDIEVLKIAILYLVEQDIVNKSISIDKGVELVLADDSVVRIKIKPLIRKKLKGENYDR